MGRPQCYPSPAARQAAYRRRLAQEMVLVNRASLTQWEARLTTLITAIRAAANANDALASDLIHPTEIGTLDNLIDWFTQRGKESEEQPSTD